MHSYSDQGVEPIMVALLVFLFRTFLDPVPRFVG
jgi:hypothetical protein